MGEDGRGWTRDVGSRGGHDASREAMGHEEDGEREAGRGKRGSGEAGEGGGGLVKVGESTPSASRMAMMVERMAMQVKMVCL
jgi:hypothetical protein